jgi:YVTN family beta-propeller protein
MSLRLVTIVRLQLGIVGICVLCTLLGAASQDATHIVFVTNWADDTVSMVDLDAGRELSVIRVGAKPYDIKVDPKGRFAYATNSGSADISVIDIQANLELHRIHVGNSPRDIILQDDGTKAYVANSGDDSISAVDLTAKRELFRIPVGAIPYGIALTPDQHRAVVTNWGENSVSIVDLASRKEVGKRLEVGSLPYTVVIPPSSRAAYLTNFGTHVVTWLDLDNLKVGGTIPVGRSPWGLSASNDGSIAIAANFYSNELSILDLKSNKEQQRIKLRDAAGKTSRRAKNTAISDDGAIIAASDLAGNQVHAVDGRTGTVLRSVAVGRAPYGLAFLPGRRADTSTAANSNGSRQER